MYYERQRGDLCRLHSLNAYFGYQKITEKEFFDYCDEYDKIIEGLDSKKMDGFAEGRCIINYIIDVIENKYTLTIPLNTSKNSREFIDIIRYKKLINKKIINYFEFNKTHVWLNKKKDNKWWKLDSISGIINIDPNINNNGIIIVFEDRKLLIKELDYNKKYIKLKLNNEIYWCNLYHLTKNIQIDNELYIEIKNNLNKFIENYRKTNFNNENVKKILLKIKNQMNIK